MNVFERLGIYLLVLFSGTIVLVLEVLGIRMLAPYFGQTLFSFSSVLGVVLAALSLGYYLGGSLGDRKPKTSIFFIILGLAGLCVVLTIWLDEWILPMLGKEISLVWGPLVGAILLLFPVSCLLGMLCPFSIAYVHAKTHSEQVGKISGLIFLVSTVGSIAGSIMSGFWLIPTWGVDTLLIAVASLLLSIGLLTWVFMATGRQRLLSLMLLVVGFGGLISAQWLKQPKDLSIIHEQSGLYDQIRVKEVELNQQTVRMLYLDRGLHNAVMVDSGQLLLPYTQHYALYQLVKPNPKNVLFLGGGAYSVPYLLMKELPEATIHVAEIDPTLWEVAQTYFHIKPDPRLNNHFMDARVFLQRNDEQFDFIYSDAFGSFGQLPYHLVTREFFVTVHEKLTDDGVFIINYPGSLLANYDAVLASLVKTIQTVFPSVQVYATLDPDKHPFQNFTVIISKQAQINLNELAAMQDYQSFKPLLTHPVDLSKLTQGDRLVWTDSYQTVEHELAKFLRGMVKAGVIF